MSFAHRSQLFFPNPTTTSATSAAANPPFLIHIKPISSHLKHHPTHQSPSAVPQRPKTLLRPKKQGRPQQKPLILGKLFPKPQKILKEREFAFSQLLSPNGYPRIVILGAITIGFVLFFEVGFDEKNRALALGGPEGPLMEEFWDNMRRYGLYVLTVSTGVAYTIFQPILELLKNPISAILILVIMGGGIYIVSQVVSAMVGVSDFNYQYSY
ncbi:hypothetical protein U1Q18_011031 [Sarracenia purpurea var. burkii]